MNHNGQPIDPTGRFRVTIRGHKVELRGWVDGLPAVNDLAQQVRPLGWIVVTSPAEPDYDPFA